MEIDTGGPHPAVLADNLNYTYNVSPMFYDALPFEDGIRSIAGMTGRDALPGLREGLAAMQDHPAKYQAMNPENGWGDYGGAVEILKTLIEWAVAHPNAVFAVS
jgi:hypothetical protein